MPTCPSTLTTGLQHQNLDPVPRLRAAEVPDGAAGSHMMTIYMPVYQSEGVIGWSEEEPSRHDPILTPLDFSVRVITAKALVGRDSVK